MFRLTILLALVIGAAMLTGGRDLTSDEMAALGRVPPEPQRPEPEPTQVATPEPQTAPTPQPVAQETAPADRLTPPAIPAAPVVSGDAVAAAVEMAMSNDAIEGIGTATGPEAPSVEAEIDAALSESQVWFVNADRVNVREGPSTGYGVVGQIVFGEATEILSDPLDEWVKIRIQGDGVEGYVARRFLQDSEPRG
jgi:hypothetical protein